MSKIQSEKMVELRTDKTYTEIYGNERSVIESEKRSIGVKAVWDNYTEEEKVVRAKNCQNTYIEKSGYTKELILEIRELHSNGLKPRFILERYPNLVSSDIKKILDKRK
jgi:hypothetical protein